MPSVSVVVETDGTNWKTRTWPELLPLPSFQFAPIAVIWPSADSETDTPDWSPIASPSMSTPNCCHAEPVQW